MLTADLTIVGSGFGGAIMAMIARRLGKSVLLLERGCHPRFAIGESSTPLANLLLEEIAARYNLPRLQPLVKWGSWQKSYPQLPCGLKRGFTFYHHTLGERFSRDPDRQRSLFVAASPRNEIADTHWYRPDFDQFLVHEAQALGAEYIDGIELTEVVFQGEQIELQGQRNGSRTTIRTQFIIDATGPRGFMHRALGLKELPFEHLPSTQALFTHFHGVGPSPIAAPNDPPPRSAGVPPERTATARGGRSIPGECAGGDSGEKELAEFETQKHSDGSMPYPPEDAAVHHLFDGGWIWVLRFNNGITSAGVAAIDRVADRFHFQYRAGAWDRLIQNLPAVQDQFAGAQALLPFMHMPKLSFRSETVSGPRFALLPSAAGFVDPLLSTGFTLNLLGILRLAAAFEEHKIPSAAELAEYAKATVNELLVAEKLVATLYATMKDFSLFAPMSRLYFAAVSYSETARRLGRADLAPGFLMAQNREFQQGLDLCCRQVLSRNGVLDAEQHQTLLSDVRETIAPIDVAGLSDETRRNCFPVLAQDLIQAAWKLDATTQEIEHVLRRCGFNAE